MTETVTLTDAATGSTARIATHLGFNCFSFRTQVAGETVEVIDAPENFAEGNERASGYGIPILFPYPNRIRSGRYSWEGKDYHLPESEIPYDGAGNAIHGFCLDRPWRIISAGADSVTGQFQLGVDAPERREYWPADAFIETRYTLRGAALRADIRVANPDDVPLPWGFGTHPYFRLPLSEKSSPSQCLLDAPAHQQWELIDCLPTGERKPVPEHADLTEGAYFDQLQLDDVLSDWKASGRQRECVIMDERAGLQIAQRCDSIFRELVVYTPPGRSAVCLEPYTCVTDAINLSGRGIDTGWQELPPGKEVRMWVEIAVEPVVV